MDRQIEPKTGWLTPRTKKWGSLSIALLAVLSFLLFWVFKSPLEISSDQIAVYGRATPEAEQLSVLGTVRADAVGRVSARVHGTITSIEAEDETMVEQGQVLARMTNTDLQLDVTRAQTQLMSEIGAIERANQIARNEILDTEIHLRQTALDLGDARASSERLRPLYERGLYPARDFEILSSRIQRFAQQHLLLEEKRDQLQDDLDTLRRDRQVRLQYLQAALDLSESILAQLDIVAPASGRLVGFELITGQILSAGEAVGTIQSEDEIVVRSNIDQFYRDRLRAGARANRVDGSNDQFVVSRVGSTITDGRIVVDFVPIQSPGEAADLTAGETFGIAIELSENASPADTVQADAIINAGDGAYLYVLDEELTHISATRVVVQDTGRDGVVRISEGLRNGQRYIRMPPPGRLRTLRVSVDTGAQ